MFQQCFNFEIYETLKNNLNLSSIFQPGESNPPQQEAAVRCQQNPPSPGQGGQSHCHHLDVIIMVITMVNIIALTW